MNELIGKKYTFEDGQTIEVIQIKDKEVNEENQPFVTFLIQSPKSLPRKLVMTKTEFINTYGHLFET